MYFKHIIQGNSYLGVAPEIQSNKTKDCQLSEFTHIREMH